jgi:hypothetical protein
MKQFLLITLILLGSRAIAQYDNYLAISTGYGEYLMNDMKAFQQQVAESQLSLIHPKMVVRFPGSMNYSIAFGRQLNDQQRIGFEYSFQNTAGRNSLIDYSGAYLFDMLIQSHTLGFHYNQRLLEGKFGPVMQFQIGYNLNVLELKESLVVFDEKAFDENVIYGNSSMFFEALGGFYYQFNQYFSIDLLFGYFLTTTPLFRSVENPKYYLAGPLGAEVKTDWSGIRAITTLYFKLPKSNL